MGRGIYAFSHLLKIDKFNVNQLSNNQMDWQQNSIVFYSNFPFHVEDWALRDAIASSMDS